MIDVFIFLVGLEGFNGVRLMGELFGSFGLAYAWAVRGGGLLCIIFFRFGVLSL